MVASPALNEVLGQAAAAAENILGRVVMTQWVIDGRVRGVTAVFQRRRPEVVAEEEGEEGAEELARPATRTRGLLVRVYQKRYEGPREAPEGFNYGLDSRSLSRVGSPTVPGRLVGCRKRSGGSADGLAGYAV